MRLDKFDFVEVENTPFGKVILIGMMEDGPTGVPFKLLENTDTTFLIGDNEVSRTYNLLVSNGIQRDDIILLRINGEPAKLRIDILEGIGINLQALTSNHFDNDIKVTVSSGGISITSNYSEELIVEGKREQFQRTYLFNDFPFTSELTEAITKDALLGYHNIIADYDTVVPTTIMSFFEDEYFFDGGKTESELVLKNGTFDDSCEDCLESKEDFLEAYWDRFHYHLLGSDFDGVTSNKISNIEAEVIYFPDVLIDEMPELAILGGRIAKEQTENQDVLCTALFRPSITLKEKHLNKEDEKTEQTNYVNKLVDLFTVEELSFKEMKNVQIVIGEDYSTNRNIMPAAAYHLVHLLSQDLNPLSNKELEYFYQLKTTLSKIEIEKLIDKGYICTMESIRKNIVTTKTQSLYSGTKLKDSFYQSRILSYITHDVRNMLDNSFVGKNISLYNLYDVEYRLTEYLQQYVDARLISSFSLGERVDDSVGYSSNIGIDIVMFGEIEAIKGSLKLNESGWEVDIWNLMN